MERTALRIATVAALLNGGRPPYPTLAGSFVYDSRIDDIVNVQPNSHRPVIVIRTDEDGTTTSPPGSAGRRTCRLLIEISVVTNARNPDGTSKVDWPQTDSQLEALLDALDWQVLNSLKGYSDWALWYGQAGFGIWERRVSSPRFAAPERGSVRLAARTLEHTCLLHAECIPKLVHEHDLAHQGNVLPPRLVDVINYIIKEGHGKLRDYVIQIGERVVRYGMIPRPIAPALERVWATLPQYEVEGDWRIEQVVPFSGKPAIGAGPQAEQGTLEVTP